MDMKGIRHADAKTCSCTRSDPGRPLHCSQPFPSTFPPPTTYLIKRFTCEAGWAGGAEFFLRAKIWRRRTWAQSCVQGHRARLRRSVPLPKGRWTAREWQHLRDGKEKRAGVAGGSGSDWLAVDQRARYGLWRRLPQVARVLDAAFLQTLVSARSPMPIKMLLRKDSKLSITSFPPVDPPSDATIVPSRHGRLIRKLW